ncbi:MAG: hypothetical protein P8X61_10050 [Limibacillus sp.]
MSKNRRLLLGHLLSSTALVGASAVGLTVTAPVGSALADCSTGMPMPGQTVNCSGVDNTGVYAGNGYRNITVNLLAGASIENPGTTAIDLHGSSSVIDAKTVADGESVPALLAPSFLDSSVISPPGFSGLQGSWKLLARALGFSRFKRGAA